MLILCSSFYSKMSEQKLLKYSICLSVSETAIIDNRWEELRKLAWRETAAGKSANQASLADSAH